MRVFLAIEGDGGRIEYMQGKDNRRSTSSEEQVVFMPTRYLNNCLTTFQCARSRLFMNLLIIPTAWAKFDHVATIAYIKEPTTGVHGTSFIISPLNQM